MKHVEYIIVGFGIAGACMAQRLLQQGKSFVVYDDAKKGASMASGGVLNPTVLKRFTAAWNAVDFFKTAIPFYKTMATRLQQHIIAPVNIQRILNSVEEQNNWMVASDKAALSRFLSTEIISNSNPAVLAPFGLGGVMQGALLQPQLLIETFRELVQQQEQLYVERFDYARLQVQKDSVAYQEISAKHIVFCQGANVRENPFFNISISPNGTKEFVGNKGEYIIVKAPKLQLDGVLKGPVMIIPLGNNVYKVGASYGRDDFSTETTTEACDEIASKLCTMISCDFEVVDQVTGIRPTVKDRKPLLGAFSDYKNVFFMNGLGTRGLSMAPLLSEWLFNFIEDDTPLPREVDLNRFL